MFFFFFQAEDGIRDLVRSRGLGDVYKRQCGDWRAAAASDAARRTAAAGTESSMQRECSWETLSLIHI